ncbi:homeodomain-interacting protein kinase 2-like isoform X2 [Paralichthys olivaceus]
MLQNRVLEILIGELIISPTTNYRVEKYLGSGSYGLVVRCRDVSTNETVALKMIKSTHFEYVDEEEAILQTMKELHSDRFNIVRLNDSFAYKGHYCLVFENLDIDLKNFMQISLDQHLQLKEIRPILQQLATSLEFLKSAGIVHADLKPQNIMLVDHVRQPLKVKVIDFGLASNNPEEHIGDILQSLWYRSPEILQRAPFNEAIDVWSLGCIAAELFMGRPLFRACDEADLMRQIFFATGKPLHEDFDLYWFWPKYWMETRFMMIPRLWGDDDQVEVWDLECFVDLLKEMLTMNQFERITARQILQHPFITMSHFEGPFKNSSYVKLCKDLMAICQDQSSGEHRDQMILRTPLNKDSSSSATDEGSHAGMRDEKSSPSPLQTSTITCKN